MAISNLNVEGTITLGEVEFIDFEMPDAVRYVPGQNTVIHKFIGGARQLDQLGSDPDVIKFNGTFLQIERQDQIDQLQLYAEAGDALVLTFNGHEFDVTIKNVTIDHRGNKWADYALELYVIENGAFDNINDVNFGAPAALGAAGGVIGA